MKRIALFTALVLLAGGIAFAQQDMGNVPMTGATYTTGIVEAADRSAFTLREDSGRLITILLATATVNADHATPGTRVRVNFHKDDQNRPVADEIQGIKREVAQAPAGEVKVTYEAAAQAPAPTPKAVPPAPRVTPPAPAPEPMAAAPLPRTASPLAAIALLGLLALGGAVALRFAR